MDKSDIGAALLVAVGAAVVFFFLCLLITFFGGLVGMAVGFVFPVVTDTIRELAGTPELTNFQVGATLGFFGSFFKSSSTSKSS